VIKLDQFFSWYNKKTEAVTWKDTIGVFKVCSSETVKDLGEKLRSLHKPNRIDYIKKFELGSALLGKDRSAPPCSAPGDGTASTILKRKEETEYFCANCKSPIVAVVAKFCWNNKTRFHGKAYCRACQVKVANALVG
jgi:DNA-directed RNA polymerase subunit RPC12/RpoP